MENEILALIASFIALSFDVSSYFLKRKDFFLIFQSLCIVFLVVSYFFTVQFFAMIGLSIGLLRVLVYYLYERRGKIAPLAVPFIVSALSLLSYYVVNIRILADYSVADVFCLLGLCGFAFAFRIRNLSLMRVVMFIPIILTLVFNIISDTALFATATYAFELGANTVAVVKYQILGRGKTAPATPEPAGEGASE